MDDEDQYEDDDEQEADIQPDPKRRRLENGPADSPPPPPNPSGLLSADTLEGLKYFAEIRQRNGGTVAVQRAPPPAKAGLGLADYGSDEDD